MTDLRSKYADPRDELPLEVATQIDPICVQFERDLRASRDVRIEGHLQSRPEFERTGLLRELLALEFEYRTARGASIDRRFYEERFPEHRELIGMLLDECATKSEKDADDEALLATLLDAHPRYRIVRVLGRGGMGTVYLAEHRVMRRLVAIKAVRRDLVSRPSAKERFAREITAAARLAHPNIVTAFDAEELGETSVLVMEYVEGQDLAQLVAEQGPLPVPEACECIAQTAAGMQHAHDLGMVHRDLKPHNLMLTLGGQVKILDFGLAHFASEAAEEPQAGLLLGSVDYMAPEQAADPRSAGIQADIYSLGCTLYFLLTGRPPFSTGSPRERLKAHARTPPACPDGLPLEVWRVLERMLAKRPIDRFQQPREIIEALQRINGAEPNLAPAGDAAPTIQSPLAECRLAERPGDETQVGERRLVADPPIVQERRRRRQTGIAVLLMAAALVAGPFLLPAGRSPAVPAPAQRLFEQAEFQLAQRKEASTANAIERLKQAVAAAPEFAAAHVALSNAYNLQGDYGWAMPSDVFPLAKASALRALELDGNSAAAHLALGFATHSYECDATQAEREFRRALELDPDSAEAHHWYAWFLLQQSRPSEAGAQIELAARLGAAKAIVATNEGRIRYFSGAYQVALDKFQEALRLDPGFAKTHLDLGQTYGELEQLDKALEQFDQSQGLTDDGRDVLAARAYALARCGKPAEARRLLPELEARSRSKPLAYEIAAVHAALKENDAAFTWLAKAFRQQSAWRTYLKIDPRLNNLRGDQRFAEYLKAAGF